MGLRSVPPCLGISRTLVVGGLFSLLIRDAVMKCVQFFDRNPSTAYKTRISSPLSRRFGLGTYPIKFENLAGGRGHGSLGNRLEVKLPCGERASVFYAKILLRRCLFCFGPFRRFRRHRTGRRFGRRRRRCVRGAFSSYSNGSCNVFLFKSFECWMSNHGSSGEGRLWRSGSLVGIRIRYCTRLVG